MAEETNPQSTAADDQRRELRKTFDSINQTAKDTREKTRDMYAGKKSAEDNRWNRHETGADYINKDSGDDTPAG